MDDCTSPAAAEVNICDDMVMEILSRLPLKRLVVCKCVSKSWHRLVSELIHSPMTGLFVNFYDANNRLEARGFVNQRDDEIDVDYSLSFLPCHPYTRLLDCRDGLLLCSSKNDCYQYWYFVCNPITRQCVPLPRAPEHFFFSYPELDMRVALILDEESDFCYSHFKVVRFVSLHKNGGVEGLIDYLFVDVYSSQTGKWEESKVLLKEDVFLKDAPSVYVDGVLFLSFRPFVQFLRYDVKKEHCRKIDVPVNPGHGCLGKSEGRLHFAYHDFSNMEVWMIKSGDSNEWVLKHSVNLADIDFPDLLAEEMGEPLYIQSFHPNSDAIFVGIGGYVFCFNLSTKAVEEVEYYNPSTMDPGFLRPLKVFPFSECLRPLPVPQRRT